MTELLMLLTTVLVLGLSLFHLATNSPRNCFYTEKDC